MSLALTEKQTREIGVFCEIAKENGSLISLRELMRLTGLDASEPEMEAVFLSDSRLRSRFRLDSGYVLQTPVADLQGAQSADEEFKRRERALANLERARRFGSSLLPGAVLVSVSGANAYLSAGEDEDIDFFCVTKRNGMWLFMLKALLLARIHMLAQSDAPEICFSCVMDEGWATQAFSDRQPPIFARDALTARVIGGTGALHSLLAGASWMEAYFPVLYGMRLRETGTGAPGGTTQAWGRGQGSTVLNSLLYLTVGTYLRMKSWARNRRLAKTSSRSAIFTTRIGPGHFIQESVRYQRLRGMYLGILD